MSREHDSLAPLSHRGLLACAALFAACCHVLTCVPRQDEVPTPTVHVEDGPPEVWATDGDADAGTISRPMPGKPFEGQKKAPCGPEQVTIKGACWEQLAREPRAGTCGTAAFEWEGRCYIPVREASRPPTSVMP